MEEKYKCQKCGTALKTEEEFCTKCGTKRGESNNLKCKYCGATIEANEKYCPKCGKKISFNINSHINKKTIYTSIIILIALIIIVVLAIKILPKIFISTNDLLKEGNYTEAYKKASSSEKGTVCKENLIAYLSNDIITGLKDPTSFLLREAWYDKDKSRVVLYTNGKNSYAASVSSYSYYYYSSSANKWELLVDVSDLEDETIYKYADTSSEKVEKYLKNGARKIIRTIIATNSFKIPDTNIKNINNLFKDDKLSSITYLSCNTPTNKSNNSI